MDFVLHVINPERNRARMETFQRRNPDLPVRRVVGIDRDQVDRAAWIAAGLIKPDNIYAPGVLANAHTHIELWRQCAQGGEPIHVAEDDAVFRAGFAVQCQDVLARLVNWDIVYWGWNLDWPVEVEQAFGLGTALLQGVKETQRLDLEAFRRPQPAPTLLRLLSCAGICAYTVSPRGAQRLLQLCVPIGFEPAMMVELRQPVWGNNGLDVEIARHLPQLAAYVSLPPLAISPNDHGESTLR